MAHPFGELLTAYRTRKHGLTQARLAQAIGYDAAVLARMCSGQRDLTGPSAREKIVSIIAVLQKEGVLRSAEEANALLAAANMPPLYDGVPAEALLIKSLPKADDKPQPAHADAGAYLPALLVHHNLPAPITSFIGREHEIAEISGRMAATRLLTLCGAGGSGKTRLALHFASLCAGVHPIPAHAVMREIAHRFHAVWWVELAPATDETVMLKTVARALNVAESADVSLTDALVSRLQNDHALLVLDNCEHLLSACAAFAMAALQGCRHLSILATSREPLNIMGEAVWRVPGLALADPAHDDVQAGRPLPDSVQLFCERAISVEQDFKLTAGHFASIAHICRRVDGMPLAIELAAVQMRSFSLDEISARLEQQFSFLATDKHMTLTRHQTLWTTMAWSDSLLSDAERTFFYRLAVFAGSCNLEAANAIAGEGLPPANWLERLVSKSLVQKVTREGLTRYRMLEPVRQYALARLTESGEEDALRQRHFLYFVDHAERVDQHMTQMQLPEWIAIFTADDDNLAAALVWAGKTRESAGQIELGLRLAIGASNGHSVLGLYADGRASLQTFFSQCDVVRAPATAHLRAVAMMKLVEHQMALGDWQGVIALQPACEACLSQCQDAQDRAGEATALYVMGCITRAQRKLTVAQSFAERSYRLFVDLKDIMGIWVAGTNLSFVHADMNEPRKRMDALQHCIDQLERLGDTWCVLTVLRTLARAMMEQGDLKGATVLLQKNLKLSEALDDHYERSWTFELLVSTDYPLALELAEAFFQQQTKSLDHRRLAAAYHQMGRVLVNGEPDGYARGAESLDHAIEHWRKCGIAWARTDSLAHTLITRAHLARAQGDLHLALACLEAGLRIAREHNDHDLIHWTQMWLGFACAGISPARSLELLKQSLLAHRNVRYRSWEVLALALLANTLSLQQRNTQAMFLLGASAAHLHELTLLEPMSRRDCDRLLTDARARLVDDEWAACWAEGQAMTLDQAIDLALQ